ncbi:MAG: SpoIID/LytB domain-containing protein [Leptolyngbyaceae cyanobacterium CSU_1_3]|nr:SpoIID/LytB domain-containing protein [Leptolyngbyaceae cyanobacterium CSU_1_3]
MVGRKFFKWLHQRPWLLLPFLGVIPLTGLALNSQQSPLPESSPSIAASPSSPSPLPSPLITIPPSPKPAKSPQPIAKASPTLKPVNPAALTKEQIALNQKAKAEFAALRGTVDSFIEMHVSIGNGNASTIASNAGATLLDEKGRSLHKLSAGENYTVQVGGGGLDIGSWQLPAIVWVEPDARGVLYLGDRPYHGRFLLVSQKGRLRVINYVNLRQYLHSVVGSEVSPSWHKQALKAQAVAARSYALTYYFRPANSLYHMGSDEYFQVYSGIKTEAETTRKAVDETAGEFVSYRGGIVESLYAASDDIVIEAFQGKGMSQIGALGLAEKGYAYQQILASYYPKTGVGRIEEDHE